MAIEIFYIDWTKLQTFDKALNQAASQEGGVYAMYRLTGRNYRLQYIGKSKDFSKRFGTHRNSASHMMNDNEMKKCFISFGLVFCFDKSRMSQDISPEQLRDIESFLINIKTPIGNDQGTKKGYKGNPIIALNSGNRGCFDKAMSNCPDLIKLLKGTFAKKVSSSASSGW